MISELVFEQIEGNFWFAAYGPFRVIMMKDTGYINATKLCSSGGKEYNKWSRLQSSQELINAYENKLALENTHDAGTSTLEDTDRQMWRSVTPPCKTVNTDNKTEVDCLISGTYCHQLLIPHIACWVSPDFALLVSEVVNGYITQEYKMHLAAAKQELDAKQLALEQATELHEATTRDANRAQQQVQQ